MYNEKVMEIFKNPQNVGEVENYNAIGTVGNATCGDIMQITLRIENDVIKDAKFKTFGCAAAITSSSVATSMIIGKTVDEALKVTNKDVITELEGLPPQKIHCSVYRRRKHIVHAGPCRNLRVERKRVQFGKSRSVENRACDRRAARRSARKYPLYVRSRKHHGRR